MNEQATMMNQQQKQQFMNMNQNLMSMNQLNPHQPQPQVFISNRKNLFTRPPLYPLPINLMSTRSQMVPINRSYGMWPPPPSQFQNPNPNSNSVPHKPPASAFSKSLGPRNNWKGKKVNQSNDKRRKDQQKSVMFGPSTGGMNMATGGSSGVVNPNYNSYQPPLLNDLQQQNRLKTRKFFPKKKFNKNNVTNMNPNMNMNTSGNINYYKNGRSAPFAPRNTSSFLIRAKKSGGIASLVSPCPVTPAVLPTPIFSPSREVLVDMAKEEWGVDGYGSMKGLIRLRSPGHEMETHDDDEGGSSESDVEEHLEVEKRLDHDLSRFEMIFDPNNVSAGGMEYHNVLENRVDDQDSHITHLEEENLILKERLFLMERELGDLRRMMQCLEKGSRGEEFNEEVVENDSENDSESREEAHSIDDNTGDFSEDGYGSSKVKGNDGNNGEGFEVEVAKEKHLKLDNEEKTENNDKVVVVADKNCNIKDVIGKEINNSEQFIEANNSPDKNETNKECIEENITKEDVAVVGDLDQEVKAADIESSDSVMLGDVLMEELAKVRAFPSLSKTDALGS